jgi:hypothetical protein
VNTMIVAGVHLDNAWRELGGEFGRALRAWSRDVLSHTISESNRRGVETLIIAGDFFNRSFALPATIDVVVQLLETFSGSVLIAPGKADWIDAASLYRTRPWPANTFIWSEPEYRPSELVPSVWASAWTSPSGSSPRLPDATGPRLVVRAGMAEAELGRVATSPPDLFVTTGAAVAEGILTVPDLVHDPRTPGGFALLVDSEDPTSAAERVELPGRPGILVELDVTAIPDTDAFGAALESALAPNDLVVLRLEGTLSPAVLLPGFGGPELPAGVVLDRSAVTFGEQTVEDSDRTARAVFLRAMAHARTSGVQRHQTTALGLAALDADADAGEV